MCEVLYAWSTGVWVGVWAPPSRCSKRISALLGPHLSFHSRMKLGCRRVRCSDSSNIFCWELPWHVHDPPHHPHPPPWEPEGAFTLQTAWCEWANTADALQGSTERRCMEKSVHESAVLAPPRLPRVQLASLAPDRLAEGARGKCLSGGAAVPRRAGSRPPC